MKFRFHTGGLEESMKTVVEVCSIQQLKTTIENKYDEKIVGEVEFNHCKYDPRTKWDTYNVLIDTGHGKHVVGQSDGVL